MLLNTVNRIASTAKSHPFQNVNSVSMRAPTLSHHIIYSLLWLRGCLSSWLKCFFLLSHLPLLPSLPASSFHSSYISAQAQSTVLWRLPSPQQLSCVWLFCSPMIWGSQGSSVHGISQARILVGCHFLLQGTLPDPEIDSQSPALAGGFFTTEPPGKPNSSSSHEFK